MSPVFGTQPFIYLMSFKADSIFNRPRELI
jgi:hypothetical protein